jgi:hypothetical protein
MRNDPESTRLVEIGSVVQIIPTGDNRGFDGILAEVSEKHTWGVVGTIRTIGVGSSLSIQRLPWSLIEPTGGKIVFNTEGKRVGDAEPMQKHHP